MDFATRSVKLNRVEYIKGMDLPLLGESSNRLTLDLSLADDAGLLVGTSHGYSLSGKISFGAPGESRTLVESQAAGSPGSGAAAAATAGDSALALPDGVGGFFFTEGVWKSAKPVPSKVKQSLLAQLNSTLGTVTGNVSFAEADVGLEGTGPIQFFFRGDVPMSEMVDDKFELPFLLQFQPGENGTQACEIRRISLSASGFPVEQHYPANRSRFGSRGWLLKTDGDATPGYYVAAIGQDLYAIRIL